MRSSFTEEPICDEALARILTAAHHAPSVGFMQPWDFIVIRSDEIKTRIHEAFKQANENATEQFEGKRKELYSRLKLEAIREAPINLCITCDRKRTGPVVLGNTSMPVMDIYSAVCAVQNLWLAARTEGLAVGWVSIFEEEDLRSILEIPEEIVPIAYLCIGHVESFPDEPELQTAGWQDRLKLSDLIRSETWNGSAKENETALLNAVSQATSWSKDLTTD